MKKNCSCLFLIFISINFCFAQKENIYLKIQGEIEEPLGNFAKKFESGNGIYTSMYYTLSNKSSLLFNLGYSYWRKKDTIFSNSKAYMVPIEIGYNYKVYSNFYVEAVSGLTILRGSFGKKTGIRIDAGAGYLFRISDGASLDLSTKFCYSNDLSKSNYNWIGIGAGLIIRFKNKS